MTMTLTTYSDTVVLHFTPKVLQAAPHADFCPIHFALAIFAGPNREEGWCPNKCTCSNIIILDIHSEKIQQEHYQRTPY